MWFMFGFITMFLFFILAAWMRAQARWSGSTERVGQYTYLRKLVEHRGKKDSYYLGLPAPEHLSLLFKRETRVDKLFKMIGFSVEHQIGTSEFDDAIYIVSDDAQVCEKLSTTPTLCAHILELFSSQSAGCQAKEIRCHGGRLWIAYKCSDVADGIELMDLTVIPLLHKVAAALGSVPRKNASRWSDPFALRAIAILSISTGLAVNFSVQAFRIFAGDDVPFTVDPAALWKFAVLAGLGGALLLAIAVTVFLGRSARAHLVLIEVLVVGTLGAAGSAFISARDMNMEWDEGEALLYEARVVDKVIRTRRKGPDSYHVVVQHWRKDNARYEIKLSRRGYDRVFKNDKLRIYERPGFLSVAWVAKVTDPFGAVLK